MSEGEGSATADAAAAAVACERAAARPWSTLALKEASDSNWSAWRPASVSAAATVAVAGGALGTKISTETPSGAVVGAALG